MKAQFNTLVEIVGSSFLHAQNEGSIQHIGSNRRKLISTCSQTLVVIVVSSFLHAQFNTLVEIVGSSFLHAHNEGSNQHIGCNRRKLIPTCSQ